MSGLDFNGLTDDQLVELVREACREAVRRNPAVEAAARAAVLDEGAKARIAADAARREAERLAREEAERIAREATERVRRQQAAQRDDAEADKVRKSWIEKARLARSIREVLTAASQADDLARGCEISVWRKGADGDGEKRVYLDWGYALTRGIGRKNKVCLYVTGNSRNAPGSFDAGACPESHRQALKAVLAAAAAEWNSLRSLNVIDPALTQYETEEVAS